MAGLVFLPAGRVGYDEAWRWQRRLHAHRVDDLIGDTCLLLEHDPVYTAGRRTGEGERPDDGSPVVDVDRGGKMTWHGPGQLTGYPIVKLPSPVDVVAHVRRLEQALVRVCADLGVPTGTVAGRSGVWVPADSSGPDRKVAAIGVRVSRGVTMHGFSLNCDCDLRWFDPIVPCGIRDAGVTSLTQELGRPVPVAVVLPLVTAHLAALLHQPGADRDGVPADRDGVPADRDRTGVDPQQSAADSAQPAGHPYRPGGPHRDRDPVFRRSA